LLAVELRERVGAELRVVGAADAPFLVDPDHRGHVDDVVELARHVVGVDEARVGGPGTLDERPGLVR
jgi:hypothetical protein